MGTEVRDSKLRTKIKIGGEFVDDKPENLIGDGASKFRWLILTYVRDYKRGDFVLMWIFYYKFYSALNSFNGPWIEPKWAEPRYGTNSLYVLNVLNIHNILIIIK